MSAIPYNLNDIVDVFTYTIVGASAQQITTVHIPAVWVILINDDGTNTNSTLWVGPNPSKALIPVRAGVQLETETSSTGNLWVQGTNGDVITAIVYNK